MIDHIDILKDGASAVYGSDAVAGVINIFLLHKFRGLEIGGSMGTQTWAPPMMRVSWKAGSKPAREMTRLISWSLPIFTIALPCTVATATLTVTRSRFPGVGLIFAVGSFPVGLEVRRLIPKLFFSANSPPPHSAPNVATSPFYKNPFVIAPNAYPGPPGIIGPNAAQHLPQTLAPMDIRAVAITFFITSWMTRRKFHRRIAKASMALLRAIFATNT